MINEAIADVSYLAGREVAATKLGRLGYAIFGPYAQISAGYYVAEFQIALAEGEEAIFDPSYPDEICGFIDIAVQGNRQIAQSNIFLSRLSTEFTKVSLPFHIPADDIFEMRFLSTGSVKLLVDAKPSLMKSSNKSNMYKLFADTRFSDEFIDKNFHSLLAMHENGARIRNFENGAIVSFRDVSVKLACSEDCQVAEEVFVGREYAVNSKGPKIAIDIGMNIGCASLALARDPTVLKVYAFEPFSLPYKRALQNFRLNPHLESKIYPFNFGLAGADSKMTVLVSETETIATSLEGKPDGRPESIIVRDAVPVLSEIFSDAANMGADVILKVDCEGSEFQIFEALERAKMLSSVRAFMVEWHKRAESRKSLQHLIEPLLANGFVVFDATRPSNLYAGFFRAVRVGA